MERDLANSGQAAVSAHLDLAALVAELDGHIQRWHVDLADELADTTSKLSDAQEQLNKSQLRRQLVELRADRDATALSIAKVSVASVLRSGQHFITMVPSDAPLEIEAVIPGAESGHVHVGDRVAIKFATFPFTRYGLAYGTVRVISPDSFTAQEDDRKPKRARPNLRCLPTLMSAVVGMPGSRRNNGRGGAKDHPAALSLFEKAARRAHVGAMFAVGAMKGGGHEVPMDRQEAQHWFRLAAERDHPCAQMMMGRYLARGLAGERDVDRARRWLKRAVAQGLRKPCATWPRCRRRQCWPSRRRRAGEFGPHVAAVAPSPPARMRRDLILHWRILRIRGVACSLTAVQ